MDAWHWRLVDLLTPGLCDAQHRYVAALEQVVRPWVRWLDLGCGRRLLPGWLPRSDQRGRELASWAHHVVGVDLDEPSLRDHTVLRDRVKADLGALPFADGSFDLVTANMVFEHVTEPRCVLREVQRILAPGGTLLFHTPNVRYPLTALTTSLPQRWKDRLIRLLDGRAGDDVFPAVYRCNDAATIERAAALSGFTVRTVQHVESAPYTAALGPLALPELVLMRLLRRNALQHRRPNLLVTLHKPAAVQSEPQPTPAADALPTSAKSLAA